jgi:hypothetical protein
VARYGKQSETRKKHQPPAHSEEHTILDRERFGFSASDVRNSCTIGSVSLRRLGGHLCGQVQ